MPTFRDITSFLYGQLFGQLQVPDVDLTSKTIVVTGANTGLGFECTKHLIGLRASRIILACRDVTKGETAVQSIRRDLPHHETNLQVWSLDLASYDSTASFAKRVQSELPRLDGLVANAGVEVTHFELAEDLELTIKVNIVSTFILALFVLPKLQKTSATYSTDTNLTMVGSLIHNFGPDAQLDVAEDAEKDIFDMLSNPKTADMGERYPLTKLMSHLCSRELANYVASNPLPSSRSGEEGETPVAQVVVNWVNPGWCQTELSRSKTKSVPEIVLKPVMGWSAEKGSRSLLHGVTAGRETHGTYLSEGMVKEESDYMRSEKAKQVGERIWRDLRSRIEKVYPADSK